MGCGAQLLQFALQPLYLLAVLHVLFAHFVPLVLGVAALVLMAPDDGDGCEEHRDEGGDGGHDDGACSMVSCGWASTS